MSASFAMAPWVAHGKESYPARPIRVIVPWPAGGGVDTFGRVIQAALAKELGQAIVIDNIGGGSGRIGTQTAARAAADGYTLLLANDSFAATEALPIAGTPPLRPAFDPVSLAISAPQGLFTHPKSGLRSIQDLAAAARARPGQLNVGVPGIGSSQHLTSELVFKAAGNLAVTHVPYRGGGPLIQDLIAGNIDAATITFSAGAQQANAGQLVPLAVTSAHRASAFPDVPTVGETIAPGFVQATWMGFLAPKGTPEDVRLRVHAAVLAALNDASVAVRLRELGFDPIGLGGAEFAKLFDSTIGKFAGIVADRQIVARD
ncbi:tripartite tricarboxylate transporter substrate binding protein [Enhydrobacter aerosaccus]|uniref:tripartite tricarboxylate transporter substrate binding protein n=1 Tax=Enhydrobacter aerosaccus TaxID=225324 RepID=UPI0014833D53|nr:tripartite tricarboxylate transporter substrate binding protein [Enhydrobacter aerosaccus]